MATTRKIGQTRIVPERCSRCTNSCIDQYPSCIGLEDGFQAWPSKPTEYWIICYKKRLLEKGKCKEDNIWKSRKLPYNGTCTSVLAIPGESLPSCAGRPNGNYDTSQFFSTGPWLCKAYYNCKDGVTTAHVCPNGTVFDGKSGECKMGSYAFSAMCQLYCSSLEWSEGYDFSEGMNECEYPQLFSSESAACENFTDVTCGTRHEEKEGCNYLKQKYNSRREICPERFPSCKSKPDGINEHPIKRPGPYFISCLQERFIGEGFCQIDTFWGVNTFPFNNTCVQVYAIPKAEYSLGKLPSCNGTTGSYRYDDSPCDVYYRCENGTATAVKCPENYNLNTVSGNCELNYPCN